MCRMIFAAGNVNVSSLLDSLIEMAQDKTFQHELNQEEGMGSWIHADGWGIAYLNDQGEWVTDKFTKTIYKDQGVERFRNIKTNLLIIHARYGSIGSAILHNTHPFHLRSDLGEFVFCHNGTITEPISHSMAFETKGTTDSEKLFYSILTKMPKLPAHEAILATFTQLKECKGTNVFFATKETTLIGSMNTDYPKYLQMSIGKSDEMLIVSSEKIPQLKGIRWEPVPFNSVIAIDNNTRATYTKALITQAQKPM